MFEERRIDPRQLLSLPVQLGEGLHGWVRDISASGFFVELPGEHHPEGEIAFEMTLSDARVRFAARGRVVRVEHSPGLTGVAVQFEDSRLLPID